MADARESSHPLRSLDGQRLGDYRLKLLSLKELAGRSGWRQFALAIADSRRRIAAPPVMEGIYSSGGKGVGSWFDIEYRESASFPGEPGSAGGEVHLGRCGLDLELFKIVGALAQSHMIVAYEMWGEFYECLNETFRALQIGIAPLASLLGRLLFAAGFRAGWKDWYIAEGGAESPKKLQAERSASPTEGRLADEKNVIEIISFLAKELALENFDLEKSARSRAIGIANDLSLAEGTKVLLEAVKLSYKGAFKDFNGLLEASKRSLKIVKKG